MSSKLCKVSRIQKRKALIDAHGKNDQIFIALLLGAIVLIGMKYEL